MKNRLPFKRRLFSYALTGFIGLCVIFVVVLLAVLLGYILWRGVGHISWPLLSQARSALRGTIGILPNIIYTLYIMLTTLAIALPVGIGAAVYLNEYTQNRRVVKCIEFVIETLAGIPSIIYGLVGFLVFVRITGRPNLLAGALTLSILVLPTIVRTTQEALKTVPNSYREGSIALGATKWHTIRTIILPSSLDGVAGGVILAIGRMVGESAALLFTAGVGGVLVTNYLQALQTSGGTLTVALFMFATEHGEFDVAFAIAALLVFVVLVLNFGAKMLRRKLKRG